MLFINVIANGLLLIGRNVYWQQAASGVLISAVLAFRFASRRLVEHAECYSTLSKAKRVLEPLVSLWVVKKYP